MIAKSLTSELRALWKQPQKWLGGIIQWILFAMVLSICIKPLDNLLDYQKAGLIWSILVMSLLQDVARCWDDYSLIENYEFYCFSMEQSGRWWRRRILAIWLLHVGALSCGIPLIAGMIPVNYDVAIILLMYWLVISPFYYLIWLLQRIVTVGTSFSHVIAMGLLLPWLIPSILVVHASLIAVSIGQSIYGYMSIVLGVSLLALVWLPRIIDKLLKEVYWRHRCHI